MVAVFLQLLMAAAELCVNESNVRPGISCISYHLAAACPSYLLVLFTCLSFAMLKQLLPCKPDFVGRNCRSCRAICHHFKPARADKPATKLIQHEPILDRRCASRATEWAAGGRKWSRPGCGLHCSGTNRRGRTGVQALNCPSWRLGRVNYPSP